MARLALVCLDFFRDIYCPLHMTYVQQPAAMRHEEL